MNFGVKESRRYLNVFYFFLNSDAVEMLFGIWIILWRGGYHHLYVIGISLCFVFVAMSFWGLVCFRFGATFGPSWPLRASCATWRSERLSWSPADRGWQREIERLSSSIVSLSFSTVVSLRAQDWENRTGTDSTFLLSSHCVVLSPVLVSLLDCTWV